MKKCRRIEDYLMILSLTISTFLMFNVSIFVGKILEENYYTNPYKFSVTLSTFIQGNFEKQEKNEKKKEVLEVLKTIEKGNVSVEVPLYINGKINQVTTQVFLQTNEVIPIEGVEGGYIQKGIMVGESLLPETFIDNGDRFIVLSGLKLPVGRVIKNHYAGGVDRSIMVDWKQLSEEEQQGILEQMNDDLIILFQSQEKVMPQCSFVLQQLSDLGIEGIILNDKNGELENQWYEVYNTVFQGLAVAFCIVSCWAASQFWILAVAKEIAIKRIIGFDIGQIIVFVFSEIMKLELYSFVYSCLIEILFLVTINDFFIDYRWILILGMTFVLVNIMILICMSPLLYRIKKQSLVIFLREE